MNISGLFANIFYLKIIKKKNTTQKTNKKKMMGNSGKRQKMLEFLHELMFDFLMNTFFMGVATKDDN